MPLNVPRSNWCINVWLNPIAGSKLDTIVGTSNERRCPGRRTQSTVGGAGSARPICTAQWKLTAFGSFISGRWESSVLPSLWSGFRHRQVTTRPFAGSSHNLGCLAHRITMKGTKRYAASLGKVDSRYMDPSCYSCCESDICYLVPTHHLHW